jgi:hypothetical protein
VKDNGMKDVNKTPEREDTMIKQVIAFLEGRKPAVLFLNRDPEKYFGDRLDSFKRMTIDQGVVVYKDDETKALIKKGSIGIALGYGVDHKPEKGKAVNLTAYSSDGVPVIDIQVDVNDKSWKTARDAALYIAGTGSYWDFRTIQEVNRERQDAR